MKLHSSVHTMKTIVEAKDRATAAGKLPKHITLELMGSGSRTRNAAFVIRLYTEFKQPGDGRRRVNTGNAGSGADYAATWDEWGWFMAEVFAADPDASFDRYDGVADFNARTDGAFLLGGTE